MSSGFVSGGTADAPIERSDEWLAAQKDIEANIARKAAEARQSDGRSLFETLEANKAAKQEAFEEANRLKNQFRALDEDEVEFLDSVLESTRAEEERVRKETAEGLALFRKQQDEADKKARDGSEGSPTTEGLPAGEEESWTVGGRKRKRAKGKESLMGMKIRRASSTSESLPQQTAKTTPATTLNKSPSCEKGNDQNNTDAKASGRVISITSIAPPSKDQPKVASADNLQTSKTLASPPKRSLSLVEYGSDSDDD